MKPFENQKGFTLLELIISITIITIIVGIALGGMRLGISTREIGENKSDIYQRLKFIGEQISKKIRSMHPMFLEQTEVVDKTGKSTDFNPKDISKEYPKYLAFEGLQSSIRLVTFSDALSMLRKPPWMHEVLFYIGTHPETQKEGLIMMERDISSEDPFTEILPGATGIRHILLAENVVYLTFRYFKVAKLSPEEQKALKDPTIKYKQEWVDSIYIQLPSEVERALFNEDEKKQAFERANRISMPKAIEISIGLRETPVKSSLREPQVVYLPPAVIPLYSGLEMERPPFESENAKT